MTRMVRWLRILNVFTITSQALKREWKLGVWQLEIQAIRARIGLSQLIIGPSGAERLVSRHGARHVAPSAWCGMWHVMASPGVGCGTSWHHHPKCVVWSWLVHADATKCCKFLIITYILQVVKRICLQLIYRLIDQDR